MLNKSENREPANSNIMKTTHKFTTPSLKLLTLVVSIGVLPLAFSACTTGTRYERSTGEYIDDHGLSSHVKSALSADTLYKYEDVNVTTFKGVVQLNGFVNTKEQKTRAGDISAKVPGVNEVKNNITIKE